MELDLNNILLWALIIFIVFFFVSGRCRLSCGSCSRENLYLSANEGTIALGLPSHPSEQLKALKAQGNADTPYGASLALE